MRRAGCASTTEFAVTRRDVGKVIVLSVRGVIDEVTTPSLATHIDIAMTSQPRVLVIDLDAVRFLSTAGISLFVEVQRLMASTDATLRVAANGPATSRPLRLLGVERMINLHCTVAEALNVG